MAAGASPPVLDRREASDPNASIVERFYTKAQWARTMFPPEYRPRVFDMGYCSIFVGREPASDGSLRWHLSIAHPFRLPTWDEVKRVRAALLPPDVHFAMPMPPEQYWLNVHNYCLHLWEVDDRPLTLSWEREAEGIRR